MHSSSIIVFLAAFLGFSAGLSLIPQCVQNCIDSANSQGCEATDLSCLCNADGGNFLPSLIGCMQAKCDSDLDNTSLLEPLQWACQLEEEPLPAAAVSSAESQQKGSTSINTQTAPLTATAPAPAPATTIVELTTIYATTTLVGGSTVTLAYPATIEDGSTTYGLGSIITSSIAPSTSSVTTTVASTSSSSQSTFSTTVLAQETTPMPSAPSTTAAAPGAQTNPNNPASTDSAPFQMQNSDSSAASFGAAGKGLVLSLALIVIMGLLL